MNHEEAGCYECGDAIVGRTWFGQGYEFCSPDCRAAFFVEKELLVADSFRINK